MKRVLLYMVCLLVTGLGLQAQSYKLVLADDIPADAARVLEQRFTQMLEAGGIRQGADEAPVLWISATPTDRMDMPGDKAQVAVVLSVRAQLGAVSGTFTVKGVGEGEADAWQRAARQILPHSKAGRELVARLKESLQ